MSDGRPEAGMPADAPAIEALGLARSFGERRVIDGLDLRVEQGAFLTVFGPNGAGKSTLLRILSTLDKPSAGELALFGRPVSEDPESSRALIGLVSHSPMLYASLSIEENLRLFARLYGVAQPQQRVRQMLARVGLEHRRYDLVRTLSRGMTQRAALARALLHEPRLLLLDEPFAGLDAQATKILDGLLAELKSSGRHTVVLVSHDLEYGYQAASHLLLLARGRELCFASVAQLEFENFAALYAQAVGEGVA
jgi:heme exporter protein A